MVINECTFLFDTGLFDTGTNGKKDLYEYCTIGPKLHEHSMYAVCMYSPQNVNIVFQRIIHFEYNLVLF